MSENRDQNQRATANPWMFWLGRIIQGISITMFILSLIGMGVGPFVFARITRLTDNVMGRATQEMTSLAETLRQIRGSLDQGDQALQATIVSLQRLEEALYDAEPVLESTSDLLSETAPEMITDTQQALIAAEEGAFAVDQVLRALAKISFITGIQYDPEQPLDEGIAEAAQSLERLPDALMTVGNDLEGMTAGLNDLNRSLTGMQSSLDEISLQLSDQREDLLTLAVKLEKLSQGIDQRRKFIQPAAILLTIAWELVLLGFVINQVASFYVGRWIHQKAFPGI